jgi:hypothetical protein
MVCLCAWLSVAGCTRTSSDRQAGTPETSKPPATQAQASPATQAQASPATQLQAPRPAGGVDSQVAEATFRKLSEAESKERVAPYLAAGETIAHPVFAGPLDSGSDTAVVIVERDQAVGAFAVVTRDDSTRERVPFPDFSQGMLDQVSAIAFMDADDRPGREVVILTQQMTGIGPEGAIPQPFNVVVTWDGRAFKRLEDVESAIYDKKTVAEIRSELKARGQQ